MNVVCEAQGGSPRSPETQEPSSPVHLSPRPEEEFLEEVYELLRTIRDPEYPFLIGDLLAIERRNINVTTSEKGENVIDIEWTPMRARKVWAVKVSLAMIYKLEKTLSKYRKVKVNVLLKDQKGSRTWDEINKQLHDKERVASAWENEKTLSWLEFMIA
eukprot:TRINITY_DN14244_c0_g1_i1.p1 TRINITY_DN14244_c0_g1~~TRINITY_DN14244_c0_g1_i1.p1  ORF type:complete len:159 (-),score=28.43 TRINITY_DN14244_c0_g1_i1:136-612(-)